VPVAAATEAELEVIPTSWNAFQKANKGKGYSPSKMGQLWREHKARYLANTTSSSSNMRSTASPGPMVQTVAIGAAVPAAADHSNIPTTWNAFQKVNSSYDVSMRLTASSGSIVQTVAVSTAVTTGAADLGSTIPTTWNAFQKANKGRGFSPAEMGQRWREQKRRHML
jgi:hypothetical protein